MPPRKFVDKGGSTGRIRLDPTLAKRKPVADVIYYFDSPSHATKLKLELARQQTTASSFPAQPKVAQQPPTHKHAEKKGPADELMANDKVFGDLPNQLAAYPPLKPVKSLTLEKIEKTDPTGIWAWQEPFLPISRRKFKCFPRLPTELRILIWQHSRPDPRIVRVEWSKHDRELPKHLGRSAIEELNSMPWKGGYRPNYSTAQIPSMLHACTESRNVALTWYELTLAAWLSSPRIYFDFTADYLYPGCDECDRSLCENCATLTRDSDRWKISKLLYRWPWQDEDAIFDLFLHFRGVKEVLFFDASSTGLVPSNVQLYNLKESTKQYDWQEGRKLYDVYLSQKDYLDSSVDEDRRSRMDLENEINAKGIFIDNYEDDELLPRRIEPYFRPEKIVRVEIDFKPDLPEEAKVTTTTNTPSAISATVGATL